MGYVSEIRKKIGHDPLLIVGASVIVTDERGRVLLQHRADNGLWGYHGGCVELAENTEDAARRSIELRKDPAAYLLRKRELAALVFEAITRKFPALEGSAYCLDVWTPATYERYTGAEIGSFMSFLFGGGTMPAAVNGRVPGIENLTFCGQWQRAPGGLPIAAACGKAAAYAIAKKYRAVDREKEGAARRVPAR